VIASFRHAGIRAFFQTGLKAGIQPAQAKRLMFQLTRLNASTGPSDMDSPGWRLHPLRGGLAGHWSVDVTGNWRLTAAFEGADAILVDYQDYH
jgi:proteic killer suppression protein